MATLLKADKKPNWYVIYVNSRAEKKVAGLLEEKGIEAFVPLVKTMRIWSDRKKMVELPLINGYVFLRIAPQETLEVLQTNGVVGFVKMEKELARIRDNEIDALKQFVKLGYHLEAGGIPANYQKGEKVKIASGVLKGVEGYIIEVNENRSLEILLESIGQSVRAVLPAEIVASI
jgi:transcription antitermination factor NusG